MVHARNGSNYSVQPDGCGQGRGKTKSRSVKSSSRKTNMEDARVAPHSPRNLSIPIQKFVQRSQRRGVGNMPKPLVGGHELLLTHQELSGSGEDNRILRRPEERVGNDSSFGDRRPSGVYQLQTSSKPAPEVSKDKPKGAQKEQKGPKNHQGKGKGKANWHRPYPQQYRIPKLEPSAVDSVFNMARDLMKFTAKEKEKINRTFPHK
ncbi:hypothetical protein O181_057501 [Austropuccinia psidii MF-1]|uniref:Uncharacterized protein n=1 Tax=Austropuccinia psidii MF-1 TaxID=1389203 RepID=A0A9Q3E8G0_9BASI|nr:hypothetical protein [Austropuccinia psidii MF-1]